MYSSQDLLHQASKALAQPLQTHQTQAGSQSELEHFGLLTNELFGQMQDMFGRKYTSRFGSDQEVDKTKRMWAVSLMKERISTQQITFALEQVLYLRMSWPPELTEFLALCDHEDVTGIPSLEDASNRIIECNTKYRFEKECYQRKYLSHPFMSVLNQRCARFVNLDIKTFNKHMDREYRKALMQLKIGQLPQVLPALPPPELPYATQDYQSKNPNNSFMQRINDVRNLFKAKND